MSNFRKDIGKDFAAAMDRCAAAASTSSNQLMGLVQYLAPEMKRSERRRRHATWQAMRRGGRG